MVESDFYPPELKTIVEDLALRGEITEGFINKARCGVYFAVEPENPLARIRVRVGGPEGPTKEELEEQIVLDMPMIVVSVSEARDTAISYVWGDYLLDYPLMWRPFIYGIFDCFEDLRAWVWQNEGVKLAPIVRDALWWQAPVRSNANLYLKHFEALGYSEIHVRPGAAEGDQYGPRIGDGVLFQLPGSPVINHAAVYVGDGKIYQHLIDHKSNVYELNRLPKSFKVRKWIRRSDKLNPGC